jgi:carboxymethylenebutenolidase
MNGHRHWAKGMWTVCAALLVGLSYPAAQASDEPKEDMTYEVSDMPVRYTSGPDTVRGILYVPRADEPRPGLIVIHEWWGLNSWVQESARRLAEQGFVALAIDLYRGGVATDAEMAHELMRAVPEDRAARDLQMAVEYLRSRKEVSRDRVGSIGWCMGGGYSLQTAMVVPDLTACVMCYGRLVTEDASLQNINAKVLGIFGDQDRGIPTDDVAAFEARARKLGKSVDTRIYEGAGHAFMNSNNTKGYNEAAADSAWTVIMDFLTKSLAPPAEGMERK